MSLSHTNDLSTALFAPGWLFETLDVENFPENDRKLVYLFVKYDRTYIYSKKKYRFWNLLESYTNQRILHMKSLTTFFSDGVGKTFFIHGLVCFSFFCCC